MASLIRATVLVHFCAVAVGQRYTISTFAGGGLPVNMPGTSASIGFRSSLAADSNGNTYISCPEYNIVLRLDSTSGIVTLIAGNGTPGFSGDNGPATSAQLNFGEVYKGGGLALDAAGNLYIADSSNHRIRKVSGGIITTIAGNAADVFGGDISGPALNANLAIPTSLTIDKSGNLYILDFTRIWKLAKGVISLFAGSIGSPGLTAENIPATQAALQQPRSITSDPQGSVYIADGDLVRKVSGGIITTVAGSKEGSYINESGPATSALLQGPTGIAVDASGTLYIAEYGGSRVRKVSLGILSPFAGAGVKLEGGDNGPALNAGIYLPTDVAVDSSGNVFISESNHVRKVSAEIITTVAGGGSSLGDNGPPTAAQFNYPTSLAVDRSGNVYVNDFGNRMVRKISNGVITTVIRSPIPSGIAVDEAGSLYVADSFDQRVYKLPAVGAVSIVAGMGNTGSGGDGGPATQAQLGLPSAIALDPTGNLYIVETVGSRVRKVAPNGEITTVAGNGNSSKSPDGAPPTAALYKPSGIASDGVNLYIYELGASRILKISNGARTTIAGNGKADDGPAINAIVFPLIDTQIALDAAGSLYFCDAGSPFTRNFRIRKISAGILTTIAGAPGAGFGGDNGPALNALLSYPSGIAVDRSGNIYISDAQSNRIRVLKPVVAPSITAVNNAAGNRSGSIAPGEIVVLTGSALGPAQIVSAQPNSQGVYGSDLQSVNVRFNGIAAPMIYASTGQLAAIVPYGITGQSAQVTVTYKGEISLPFSIAVAAAAPALFTADSTGHGQAAVLNQNGSFNSASNPAPVGSYISLFATGEGQTTPAGIDGKTAAAPLPIPLLPVSVTIGGQIIGSGQLQYAGAAPGQVAGLLQINVRIPANTFGQAVPVSIQVGNAASPGGATIAIAQ